MYEPRDRSGPMDVDQSDPLGRAAQYALDDGPARKRPHSSLAPDPFNPFAAPTPTPSYRFGPNTPFLFHAPPLPPTPVFETYDPNRWARTDFGFGPGATPSSEVADVDMGEEETQKQETPKSKAKQPLPPRDPTPSSPKAEVDTPERKIATGALTRVRRRRKQWARRKSFDDDQDDRVARRPTGDHTYNLHMSQGTRHSEVPAILLGYVQFIFNLSLVLGFLYIAVQFILAVRRDVKERIEEYSVEILQEIAQCTQAYMTNRCEPNLRVPAMEAACAGWELCMNRDPTVVGRARVGAETFAGVINSFVDPISWKTMGFTLVTLTFLIVLTNSALFNLRAKHQAQVLAHQQFQHQQQQQFHQYPPWAAPGQPQGLEMPPSQGVAGKAMGWLKK